MAGKKASKKATKIAKKIVTRPATKSRARRTSPAPTAPADAGELVVITGLSGAGKASALKAFEDLGYYSVDNLPVMLISRFADLVRQSREIARAAIVVDVREGDGLRQFPSILKQIRKSLSTKVLFLDASDEVLSRRFSETRRPHPLGRTDTVLQAIRAERKRLDPIRNVADINLDTSKFNVHELRAHVTAQFERGERQHTLLISFVSFGFKGGVPPESDMVFDVRFLPNPHFIPEFRPLTGRDAKVARYIRQFPQTRTFIKKTTDLLLFLIPNYVKEGKSYLTVAFGCTGGQHRSVMIAEEIAKQLAKAGFRVKVGHRDMPRS